MLNYEVNASLLEPFVPAGTRLDAFDGRYFVSLVGFLFADTRLLGVPVPWHRTFEEVNLRFYVSRTVAGETRRAVTFIKELVPRRAIATVARAMYNEPYDALPMRHRFGADRGGAPTEVEYAWRLDGEWKTIRAVPRGDGQRADSGSHEEFITEHYWGYTRQRDGSTVEYEVEHPRWRIWSLASATVNGDLARTYGDDLASVLTHPPASAFLADGSPVAVGKPTRLSS